MAGKITDRQRRYAVQRVLGFSPTTAARLAGYSDPGSGSSAIRVRAFELERRPGVLAAREAQRDRVLAAALRKADRRAYLPYETMVALARWPRCPAAARDRFERILWGVAASDLLA